MTKQPNKRLLGLALSTALTSVALAGCSSAPAGSTAHSAIDAESAVASKQDVKAIAYAEQAVTADPRNADYRALLASAYLEAGRFQSAATSYAEAIELGDNSARTALGHALAAIGAGDQNAALDTLVKWDGAMDAGDYGLALALAGRPAQGAHILGNAIRNGQNTAKVRQNLAYAYALAGDWRAARVMAAEDVPADQLGDRLGTWAVTSAPEFYQQRVARLLGTPVVRDSGMPAHLALANYPEGVALADASDAVADPVEVAYVDEPVEPVAAVAVVEETPVEYVAVADQASGPRFVSNPVVQALPERKAAPAPVARSARAEKPAPAKAKPVAKAPTTLASGDYRIQLGSFLSEADAERAKGVYAKKYPQLDRKSMAITLAEVNGKTYYRVSAGGIAQSSAKSMCSSIKAAGNGCIAYAESTPLPGALDRGTRVASR